MAHIDYHAVLEALQNHQDRCPLCCFLEKAEDSYFDSLLYSWVGTEGFQDRFLAANGFCPAHAHHLREQNDGVAVAMLYAPLLKHRLRWQQNRHRLPRLFRPLGRLKLRRNQGPAARGSRASLRDCPLCEQIALWETHFLHNLFRHQKELPLQEAFRSGTGLCLPHFERLLWGVGKAPAWLSHHQDERVRTLQESVEEYASGSQGRNSTVWRELLEYMEGPARAVRHTGHRRRFRS
ncbi:hypothetical protein SAMN05920897_11074 [Alkalispirochaeta americana]|uniref:Uncharacterized protein n=1 Tax=Alkalispirochaeta americana TaxID=159291 RepID=A0A1N6TJ41_9SPIO|nr:DUF6062 family protein [Alkalispirochaeta americana]SIQ53136.1 hypothetical protein SAMN05920897_11074 [Alkalispirochaeta americana]